LRAGIIFKRFKSWLPYYFAVRGERRTKAKLREDKEIVKAVKIDTLVEQLGLERVDFIKMDIEGAEVDALLGAKETISQFKPKLAICTYHRPTDPIEIRKILLKYNPNYKFKEIERGEKVLFAWDDKRKVGTISPSSLQSKL
jgi:hypothetical protein